MSISIDNRINPTESPSASTNASNCKVVIRIRPENDDESLVWNVMEGSGLQITNEHAAQSKRRQENYVYGEEFILA